MSARRPPPTQVIVDWVIRGAGDSDERLDVVCSRVLTNELGGWSADEIADLVEQEVTGYLPEALRNAYAKRVEDGGTPFFEIDSENPPYIRKAHSKLFALHSKLRQLDWKLFESLCSEILNKLGGTSKVTGQPNDGGVDFYATGIRTHSNSLPLPRNAALSVIGQAKRYDNAQIKESEIRKFVGGALLKLEELKRGHALGLLGPTIFAFWTSSDLHENAREYARSMGIWYMDGMTFAQYIQELGLEDRLVITETRKSP